MNPWILSSNEVQILKCVIVGLKSYLEGLFCSKSYSFVSSCINKIQWFCFPSNLCFISCNIQISVPRLINPTEQWITRRGVSPDAWGIRDDGCIIKHSCVHIKRKSWCESQAIPPPSNLLQKNLHFQLFEGA